MLGPRLRMGMSEAAEIDRLFDGVGFDCRFHGRFRVSGTVLAQRSQAMGARTDAGQGASIGRPSADQL